MKKYNEENIIPLLKSLKIDETTAEDDFTSKVMNRIKADIDFDNNIDDLDKVDNLLNILPVKEIMQPKEDFTANVMNRIKSEQKKVKYNQENIQDVLKLLKTKPIKLPNKNFAENVMEKIKEEEVDENIISFEKTYKKFLVGSFIVAAAAILLALNLFSTYNPSMAEFMVTDYFNTGLY